MSIGPELYRRKSHSESINNYWYHNIRVPSHKGINEALYWVWCFQINGWLHFSFTLRFTWPYIIFHQRWKCATKIVFFRKAGNFFNQVRFIQVHESGLPKWSLFTIYHHKSKQLLWVVDSVNRHQFCFNLWCNYILIITTIFGKTDIFRRFYAISALTLSKIKTISTEYWQYTGRKLTKLYDFFFIIIIATSCFPKKWMHL